MKKRAEEEHKKTNTGATSTYTRQKYEMFLHLGNWRRSQRIGKTNRKLIIRVLFIMDAEHNMLLERRRKKNLLVFYVEHAASIFMPELFCS